MPAFQTARYTIWHNLVNPAPSRITNSSWESLDLGAASKFHYLGNRDQMIVVDIHLFLADQMRFEMMRRLGWIKTFEGGKYSLLNMVQDFDKVKTKCRQHPPLLVESNPAYTTYTQLTIGDKEVFIRRMLQEALDAFKERL